MNTLSDQITQAQAQELLRFHERHAQALRLALAGESGPPAASPPQDLLQNVLASLKHLHTLHGPCDGATCSHARVIGELENAIFTEHQITLRLLGDPEAVPPGFPHDPQILADALLPCHDGGKERAMTLLQQLEALEATEAKATKGPWNLNWGAILADGISTVVCQIPEGEDFLTSDKWQNDRALIADSRNLLKPLLALVKAQREALENIRDFAAMEPNANDQVILDYCNPALQLGNQEHP